MNQFLPIWNAVKIVESGNNPDTINFTEAAYGAGQIRQEKLNDYNRANNTAYTLKDCLNEEISRKVFFWHCRGYKDIEKAIIRWNGAGASANRYLAKVNQRLDKI